MDKKKILIDKSSCIGCGACAGTYPDDIQMDDDGLASTINGVADADAVDVCPVGAISVEE